MMCAPDFYRDSEHVCSGRKLFKCTICRGEITKGQKYTEIIGKWEGEFDAFKAHSSCYAIYNACIAHCAELGFQEDDFPTFRNLIDYAQEDFYHGGKLPLEYWPTGVSLTAAGLREYSKGVTWENPNVTKVPAASAIS